MFTMSPVFLRPYEVVFEVWIDVRPQLLGVEIVDADDAGRSLGKGRVDVNDARLRFLVLLFGQPSILKVMFPPDGATLNDCKGYSHRNSLSASSRVRFRVP